MHTIIDSAKASKLRLDFIRAFVDTSTDYYKELEKNKMLAGFLYDTLYRDTFTIVPFGCAIQALAEKNRVYSMWDSIPNKVINPKHGIITPHYLELYKSDTIIEWDTEELTALLTKEIGNYNATYYLQNTLPEDIYIFDDSFDWCVIFTHSPANEEETERGCLIYSRKMLSSNPEA